MPTCQNAQMHRHMHTTNQPRPAQPFRVKQCGFSPKLSSVASAPKFKMQPISCASDILAELVQEVDPQMIDWKFKGPAIEWWLTMNVELVNDEWWMMNDHPPPSNCPHDCRRSDCLRPVVVRASLRELPERDGDKIAATELRYPQSKQPKHEWSLRCLILNMSKWYNT